MENNSFIVVECVYALKEQQTLLTMKIQFNATIKELILASGLLQLYPELKIDTLSVGIFGQQKSLQDQLASGDRVEIYRPLLVDPMNARRRRAPPPKRRKF